jgi:hypothetical protein
VAPETPMGRGCGGLHTTCSRIRREDKSMQRGDDLAIAQETKRVDDVVGKWPTAAVVECATGPSGHLFMDITDASGSTALVT